MTKMKERNLQLQTALNILAPKGRLVEIETIPKEDTTNRQGYAAYSVSDESRLVAMLNTLKIEPQFYRSENEQMKELNDLINKIASKDPYFVAQAIVWSRCMGEGMRAINHLAATLLAPFVSGTDWGKRFYGPFNKTSKSGGCIFRIDDMSEIKDIWSSLTTRKIGDSSKMLALPNAMKKGFANVIETADGYQLAKYKKSIIDISNLVHPDSAKSKATVKINDEVVKILDALMKGMQVSADTWETAQSEAGQIVAKAVKEGKISATEADKILSEAKADNWEALLTEHKLGVLACLRNIRNIMQSPRPETINAWCETITNPEIVRKALILPIHFDLAYDVVNREFSNYACANQVRDALHKGYLAAIPNLSGVFTGKTLIVVDCSGSMTKGYSSGKEPSVYVRSRFLDSDTTSCSYKAGLVAATIAMATKADIVRFGSSVENFQYNPNLNIFALADEIARPNLGCTHLYKVFEYLCRERRVYDRIIILSDNETNGQVVSTAYKNYLRVCSPYIYDVDMAAYGTAPIANDGKLFYMFGYGPSLYENIAKSEFNPESHLEEIRKIVI